MRVKGVLRNMIENLQKILQEKNYTLIEYINDNEIVVEYDGYRVIKTKKNIANTKPNVFNKNNPYYQDNIQELVTRKNKGVKVETIYQIKQNGNHRKRVSMICICGKPFSKTLDHIYSDTYCLCNKCSKLQQTSISNRNYRKKYIKDIQNAGYRILDKNVKLQSNKPVEVEEVATGYRGFIYPNTVKNYKKLLVFSLHTNKKNLIYNLNIFAKAQGCNTVVTELVDSDNYATQRIKCQCGICHNLFITTYRAFSVYNGKWYCDNCTSRISKNEKKVQTYLEQHEIQYIKEFRINACKDDKPLPFDFYLTDYNCFIEVDGEQHYKIVKYGNETDEIAQKRLLKTKEHDNIKTEYCNNWNIPLLRLPYWEFYNNNYQSIIFNFLNTVQK